MHYGTLPVVISGREREKKNSVSFVELLCCICVRWNTRAKEDDTQAAVLLDQVNLREDVHVRQLELQHCGQRHEDDRDEARGVSAMEAVH